MYFYCTKPAPTSSGIKATVFFMLLLCAVFTHPTQASATGHTYVDTFPYQTNSELYPRDSAIDSDGSVITVGEFTSSATFAPGTAQETTLATKGGYDIFIAKYLSSGTLSWVVNIGGTSDDKAFSVAVGTDDTIYVAGTFMDEVAFNGDSGSPGTSSRTAAGNTDSYVVKYTSNGIYSWVVAWGNTEYDNAQAIARDSSDNIYVGGNFDGAVDFDPSGSTNTISGSFPAYISKFSSSGTYGWTKTWAGTIATVNAIEVNSTDTVYAVGNFTGTADFDPGAGTDSVASAGDYDGFVVEYTSGGTYQQVVTLGSTSTDFINEIAIDSSDNVYMACEYSETVDFDPSGSSSTNLSQGGRDGCIWALDETLAYRWYASWGSLSHEGVNGIVVTDETIPMVYATGFFNDSARFDPDTRDENTSAGNQDIYAIAYASTGTYDWHTVWGDIGGDFGSTIVYDPLGKLYIAGYYANTVDFDFGAGVDSLTANATDGFLTVYSVPAEPVASAGSSSTGSSGSAASVPAPPGCPDTPPVGAPTLFQINRSGSSATLFFTPVKNNATSYFISYGLGDISEGYGVSFPYTDTSGVVSYTVNALDPAKTYTFKVRSGNGCATGLWSHWLTVGTSRTQLANTSSSAGLSVLVGVGLLVGGYVVRKITKIDAHA